MSVGNLTPGFQWGVELSIHDLNFSGTSFSNKEGPDRLLSPESVPSGGGTFVQPSENSLYPHLWSTGSCHSGPRR